jgi:hypothetical protein
VRDQDLSTNTGDVSMRPPHITEFLSPKMFEAIEHLLPADDEGMADDLHQSSEETPPSPSFDDWGTPVDMVTVDAYYFEVVSAEVAAAATRAAEDLRVPAVRPLERESTVSVTAKAAAFPLAAGAADGLAHVAQPDAAAEDAVPHVNDEDATADEDASGGEWWW